MNSLKLLFPTLLLFLTVGLVAADEPPFSDNPTPIFENTYLIDNIGNNSRGADLTLRVHRNAPFGNCNNKVDCPASVIVSGATGNVNMPVDVNVRSLHVGKSAIIDSSGKWVGPSTGLVGPAGPQGSKGDAGAAGPQGPQGLKGDTGATGPAGPQGLKGDTGEAGPQGPQGLKGDRGADGPQGLKGDTGPVGPQGPKGDAGAAGPQGPQGTKGDRGPAGPQGPQGVRGDNGEGCWYDDKTARINCAGGTWIETSSLKGPKGDTGAIGPQGPQGVKGNSGATGPQGPQGLKGDTGAPGPQGQKGDSGRWNASACREVTSYLEQSSLPQMIISSECAADEFLLSGYCSISNAGQLRSWTPDFSRGRFSCYGWRQDGVQPLWGDLKSTAVCCKK
jgi:hypothetical protein